MKLTRKLVSFAAATVCAASFMCGGEALLTVGADETYGMLTYSTFDKDRDGTYDFAEIIDCDKSAVSVNIPAEIEGLPVLLIEYGAFKECTQLKSVSIPDSVIEIGESAFENCTSLENIIIPNSVTNIHRDVFRNCTSLESVTIPESVVSIARDVFSGTALVNNQTDIKYVDEWVVDCDKDVTSAEIKNGTKGIACSAFSQNTKLKSVKIPDSVELINASAFYRCESLESITIPDSVKEIGNLTFSGCKSLSSVRMSNSVKEIGYGTYSGTNLNSVIIPKSVKGIGSSAFSSCESLESVTLLNPDCEFWDSATAISNGYDQKGHYYNGTICGYENSTAEKYAADLGYKFLAISDYGVLGDADGDGKVSAKDASLIFSEFKRTYGGESGSFTAQQIERCDLSGDGKITALDASKVFTIYKENYRKG